MAKIELIMPKMGESIIEATILEWLKKEGDPVDMDESVLEIATDKVDSEVPAPEAGVMGEILYKVGDVVAVGEVIAYLMTGSGDAAAAPQKVVQAIAQVEAPEPKVAAELLQPLQQAAPSIIPLTQTSGRFYSPLVMSMAKAENIGMAELERIPGTGKDGRVTKRDMLAYLKSGRNAQSNGQSNGHESSSQAVATSVSAAPAISGSFSGGTEIIEMDRMRKLIADHMINSKKTSPHVTSFVEADVTNLVNWRNKVKGGFQKKYGQKITFTPLFVEAVVAAIQDFPKVNSSVDGYNWIIKKDINVGIATALPSGNLIVPVVKNADRLSLLGITQAANELIGKARSNSLKPQDIQGGTFTVTNVGTFGNLSGTPIINQPQVAILATGAIIKKPAVLETEYGDVIAIRHMMFMSLSYDHRVVDGFLGGSFLRRVADKLEQFDATRVI